MTLEIILGPPGCGKTHTLLDIVDQCLDSGIAPEEIGLVSFTRRAAQEAVTRASEKFGLDRDRFIHFRTLHSTCFRQLGLSPGDVLQGRVLREFADWCGIELTFRRKFEEGGTFGFTEGDRILHMENLARVRCQSLQALYDEDNDDLPWSEVERVSVALAEYKQAKHLIDYTDMLSLYAQGRARPRLRVLLGDEVQDMSLLQWQVFGRLSQGCERVVTAGDDDQAIYRWAGAALEYFVGLPGRATVLGRSHRVPRAVQGLALECIGRVATRRPKEWAPREEEGTVDRAGDIGQVDLSGADILILARNNYVLQDQVVPILRAEGMIYEHNGLPSVDPEILHGITIWEEYRKTGNITDEERKFVKRWHSKQLPEKPAIWHDGMDRLPMTEMSYLLAARRRGESLQKKPRVRLSTIHGAKGAQADHVVLMEEMAPRTYREMEKLPEDEARVWYVGLTRARERLTMVHTAGRYGWEM